MGQRDARTDGQRRQLEYRSLLQNLVALIRFHCFETKNTPVTLFNRTSVKIGAQILIRFVIAGVGKNSGYVARNYAPRCPVLYSLAILFKDVILSTSTVNTCLLTFHFLRTCNVRGCRYHIFVKVVKQIQPSLFHCWSIKEIIYVYTISQWKLW